ncbi:hypothetical protein BASA81_003226 [Batrachochytrium salamandrivorans]|nr:hypothetical protein BASA81_003226 [Batrachochytrium salamandrivorans]
MTNKFKKQQTEHLVAAASPNSKFAQFYSNRVEDNFEDEEGAKVMEHLAPLTPPSGRNRKRLDYRTSAERGIRKVSDCDFKTPPKSISSGGGGDGTDTMAISTGVRDGKENDLPAGLAAPRRSRKPPPSTSSPSPRYRFLAIIESDKRDEEAKLADLMNLTLCL